MDSISGALAKSSILAALDAAKQLMSKLLGPAAEEAGLLLEDIVRTYRLRNQLRMLAKTQEMLKRAGIEPKAVPLRVLVPILSGASLEDNEDLSSKWAALLANASTFDDISHLSHIFADILRQLSPVDALILGKLASQPVYCLETGDTKLYFYWGAKRSIIEDMSLNDDDFDLSIDNLCRLGVCVASAERFMYKDRGLLFGVADLNKLQPEAVVVTQLGHLFLCACSPPSHSGNASTLPKTIH